MTSLLALLLALLAALYGYKNRGWIGPAMMTGMLRMRLGMTAMAAVLLTLPMRMRLAPAALAALLLTLPGRLRLAPRGGRRRGGHPLDPPAPGRVALARWSPSSPGAHPAEKEAPCSPQDCWGASWPAWPSC